MVPKSTSVNKIKKEMKDLVILEVEIRNHLVAVASRNVYWKCLAVTFVNATQQNFTFKSTCM